MPMKKTWLLRVAEIREELEAIEAPVIEPRHVRAHLWRAAPARPATDAFLRRLAIRPSLSGGPPHIAEAA